MAAPLTYAHEGAIEDHEHGDQIEDDIFFEDDADFVDDDDEGEMLQDALEEMVAQAEARDSFGAQFDDSDHDSDYIPSDEDGSVYQDLIQDAGGLEIEIEDDDDQDDDDDDDDQEDGDDDRPDDRESVTIDIRDLLRAHLAASSEQDGDGEDDGTLSTREAISRALNSIGIAGLQRLFAASSTMKRMTTKMKMTTTTTTGITWHVYPRWPTFGSPSPSLFDPVRNWLSVATLVVNPNGRSKPHHPPSPRAEICPISSISANMPVDEYLKPTWLRSFPTPMAPSSLRTRRASTAVSIRKTRLSSTLAHKTSESTCTTQP